MKFKSMFILLLSSVIVSVCSISCNKNEEEDSVEKVSLKQQLIGLWKSEFNYADYATGKSGYPFGSNWIYFELKKDGTVVTYSAIVDNEKHTEELLIEDGHMVEGFSSGPCHWDYYESEGIVNIYSDDRYYDFVIDIALSEDGKKWKIERDNRVYYLTKIN